MPTLLYEYKDMNMKRKRIIALASQGKSIYDHISKKNWATLMIKVLIKL